MAPQTDKLLQLRAVLGDLLDQSGKLHSEFQMLSLNGREMEAIDVLYMLLDLFDGGVEVEHGTPDQ